jgi:hypothetical protein
MFGLKAAPPARHGGIEAIQSWRLDAQHLGHLFRKVGIALFQVVSHFVRLHLFLVEAISGMGLVVGAGLSMIPAFVCS